MLFRSLAKGFVHTLPSATSGSHKHIHVGYMRTCGYIITSRYRFWQLDVLTDQPHFTSGVTAPRRSPLCIPQLKSLSHVRRCLYCVLLRALGLTGRAIEWYLSSWRLDMHRNFPFCSCLGVGFQLSSYSTPPPSSRT